MISTRREFMTQLGLLAAIRGSHPDLVLYNGNFITVDSDQPRAQAVAITRGRLSAVGSNADVRAFAGASTKLIDLGGKTVVPGFIDAHSHPAVAGRLHLRQVDADLRSIAAIQAAIRERAAKTPKGERVLAFNVDLRLAKLSLMGRAGLTLSVDAFQSHGRADRSAACDGTGHGPHAELREEPDPGIAKPAGVPLRGACNVLTAYVLQGRG